ncbi:MAG: JAB domain-containing protein [Candidatus Geothermincolia bacterium]
MDTDRAVERHYALIDTLTGRGPDQLTDLELLALVFGGCVPVAQAAERALEYIEYLGPPASIQTLDHGELTFFKGIGEVKAAAIVAGPELGRRSLKGVRHGERLASSADVYNTFWPSMLNERVEIFSCALVDAKLRLVRTEVISRGTLTASIVHPRESFRPAVRSAASGVIFAHNHPSGDPVPSEEDRRITGRLEEVGRILGIPMLDHVIVGAQGSYYSFADAGDLEPQAAGYRGMVLR